MGFENGGPACASRIRTHTDQGGNVIATFTLANTGSRAGAEIAQVYATLPPGLGEPPQRLVGWAKVALRPGQSQQVSVVIPARRRVGRYGAV